MIHDLALLLAGSTIVCTGVAYFSWTYLRIVLLRQQLFDIRDHLWDQAREFGGLTDHAYREARKRLNDTIRVVRWITLPVILNVSARSKSKPSFLEANSRQLQVAIDQAYSDAAKCIQHYLMRHTLCGLFVSACAYVYANLRIAKKGVSRIAAIFKRQVGEPVAYMQVKVWISSPELNELSEAEAWAESKGPRRREAALSRS